MPTSKHLLRAFTIRLTRRQLSLLAAVLLPSIILLLAWHNQDQVRNIVSTTFRLPADEPLCRQLPGAENVVIVMKTGATEVQDKLTVHLKTTLKCYPNQAIFSDYEEDLPSGHHLYDAFKYTSSSIKDTHPDFALWRRLQDVGRSGLSPEELSGADSRETDEEVRMKIPGWKLDKWKFLPIVNQTLHMFPDKHWYMFVEADTYLFWSSLLPYLDGMSWTDDHYIGSRAGIELISFAHGGSGYLLSRPALEKVVKLFNDNKAEWEDFTDRYWVGDHILASALRDAGVFLQDATGSWQKKPVGVLDLRPGGDGWCSPAVTSHHLLPTEIQTLWKFEQNWISKTASANGTSTPLRWRAVLEKYILTRIHDFEGVKGRWDNMADELRKSDAKDMLECQLLCEADTSCMQLSLDDDGNCRVSTKLMLGEESDKGITSSWDLPQIYKLLESQTC